MKIYSMDELNKFLSILPDLQHDEVYFLCLFARNKADKELAKSIGLNRCSTVDKAICRTKEHIIKNLKKFEACAEAETYITSTGEPIPSYFLVPYITIHPVSVMKAYEKFNATMLKYLIETNSGNRPNDNTFDRIKKSSSLYIDCHQHTFSRKSFIDLDYDGEKYDEHIQKFMDRLEIYGVVVHTIETNGGYHLLLDKKTIKFNYDSMVQTANNLWQAEFVDNKDPQLKPNCIEKPDNGAIPVPGCTQYNFQVRLLT